MTRTRMPRRAVYAPVVAGVLLLTISGCATGPADQAPTNDTPVARLVGDPVAPGCRPWGDATIPDSYLPGAPETKMTGTELAVRGFVLVSGSCRALAGARLEFWHSGRDGSYDDTYYRGTTYTTETGAFELQLTRPGAYENASSHVHILVAVPGYQTRAFTVETGAGATVDTTLVLETPAGV